MNPIDRELKAYFRELSKHMAYMDDGKRLLSEMRFNINNYRQEHPDASYLDVVERFGTPMEICKTYLENLDVKEYEAKIRKSRFIKRAVVMAVATILILFSVVVVDRLVNRPAVIRERIEIHDPLGGTD